MLSYIRQNYNWCEQVFWSKGACSFMSCFSSCKSMLELFKREKQKQHQKTKHPFPFLIPRNSHQQQGFQSASVSFGLSPYTCTFYWAMLIDTSKEANFLFQRWSPEICGHYLLPSLKEINRVIYVDKMGAGKIKIMYPFYEGSWWHFSVLAVQWADLRWSYCWISWEKRNESSKQVEVGGRSNCGLQLSI